MREESNAQEIRQKCLNERLDGMRGDQTPWLKVARIVVCDYSGGLNKIQLSRGQ